MINCICVDKDKKSREELDWMIRKISNLHLAKSYASLATAVQNCSENSVQIMFISLYDFPVDKKDIALLKKIMAYGTKIVVLSSRIGVVADAIAINVSDYIMIPTSSRRLWKSVIKSLNINDFGIDTPILKIIQTENSFHAN